VLEECDASRELDEKSDDSSGEPPTYLARLSNPQEEVQGLSSVHGASSLRHAHRLSGDLMWPAHKSFHNVSIIQLR